MDASRTARVENWLKETRLASGRVAERPRSTSELESIGNVRPGIMVVDEEARPRSAALQQRNEFGNHSQLDRAWEIIHYKLRRQQLRAEGSPRSLRERLPLTQSISRENVNGVGDAATAKVSISSASNEIDTPDIVELKSKPPSSDTKELKSARSSKTSDPTRNSIELRTPSASLLGHSFPSSSLDLFNPRNEYRNQPPIGQSRNSDFRQSFLERTFTSTSDGGKNPRQVRDQDANQWLSDKEEESIIKALYNRRRSQDSVKSWKSRMISRRASLESAEVNSIHKFAAAYHKLRNSGKPSLDERSITSHNLLDKDGEASANEQKEASKADNKVVAFFKRMRIVKSSSSNNSLQSFAASFAEEKKSGQIRKPRQKLSEARATQLERSNSLMNEHEHLIIERDRAVHEWTRAANRWEELLDNMDAMLIELDQARRERDESSKELLRVKQIYEEDIDACDHNMEDLMNKVLDFGERLAVARKERLEALHQRDEMLQETYHDRQEVNSLKQELIDSDEANHQLRGKIKQLESQVNDLKRDRQHALQLWNSSVEERKKLHQELVVMSQARDAALRKAFSNQEETNQLKAERDSLRRELSRGVQYRDKEEFSGISPSLIQDSGFGNSAASASTDGDGGDETPTPSKEGSRSGSFSSPSSPAHIKVWPSASTPAPPSESLPTRISLLPTQAGEGGESSYPLGKKNSEDVSSSRQDSIEESQESGNEDSGTYGPLARSRPVYTSFPRCKLKRTPADPETAVPGLAAATELASEYEEVAIYLDSMDSRLGWKLVNALDEPRVMVSYVSPHSGQKCNLKKYDRILSVNAVPVTRADAKAVERIIKDAAGRTVSMIIRRDVSEDPSGKRLNVDLILGRQPRCLGMQFELTLQNINKSRLIAGADNLQSGDRITKLNSQDISAVVSAVLHKFAQRESGRVTLRVSREKTRSMEENQNDAAMKNRPYSHSPPISPTSRKESSDSSTFSMTSSLFSFESDKSELSSGSNNEELRPSLVSHEVERTDLLKTQQRIMTIDGDEDKNQGTTIKTKSSVGSSRPTYLPLENGLNDYQMSNLQNSKASSPESQDAWRGLVTRGNAAKVRRSNSNVYEKRRHNFETTSQQEAMQKQISVISLNDDGQSHWTVSETMSRTSAAMPRRYTRKSQWTLDRNLPRVLRMEKSADEEPGLTLCGGNKVGIFVKSVLPGSMAEKGGLCVGDRILQLNSSDLSTATLDFATRTLLWHKRSTQFRIEAQFEENYDEIMSQQPLESLYVRCLCSFQATSSDDHSFAAGDIFHVTSTMMNYKAETCHWQWYGERMLNSKTRPRAGLLPRIEGFKLYQVQPTTPESVNEVTSPVSPTSGKKKIKLKSAGDVKKWLQRRPSLRRKGAKLKDSEPVDEDPIVYYEVLLQDPAHL